MSQLHRISIAGITLLAAACADPTEPVRQERGAPHISEHSPANVVSCPGCIVGSVIGPITLTRGTGAPTVTTFAFPGDPAADYIVDVDDNGSRGLTGSVSLNGESLVTTANLSGSSHFHMRQAVTVRSQNTLVVTAAGDPGSTLTLELRSGVKTVGPEGGTLRAPGGAVTLDFPAGALSQPTEIGIGPADPPAGDFLGSWDLTPSGLQFTKPVTLAFPVNPALVAPNGPGLQPIILTQALPSDTAWTIVPGAKYDAAAGEVVAPLSHFSTYTEWLLDPADIKCARIIARDIVNIIVNCVPPPLGEYRDTIDVDEGGTRLTGHVARVQRLYGPLWIDGVMVACENVIAGPWPVCVVNLTTSSDDPSIAYRDATGFVHGIRNAETVLHAHGGLLYSIGESLVRVHPGTHLFSFATSASADVGVGTGSLSGGAALSGGRLTLDGVTGFVQVASRLIPPTGNFSVNFFARESAPRATYVEFISQGISGSGFYVGHTPNGILRVSDAWFDTGVPMPSDNLEHHYAVTFDATSQLISLYLDGQLRATHTGAIARGSVGGNDTRFGRQFNPFTEQLVGTVDNVSVNPAVLSSSDVQLLSRRTSDLPCSAEGTVFSGASAASQIVFENQSGEAVRIEWLNSLGQRVLYVPSLSNGTVWWQNTFLSHPWIVTGLTSGKCYGIWRSLSTGRIVTIN